MKKVSLLLVFISFLFGEEFQVYSGDIIKIDSLLGLDIRDCPANVDSCINVCNNGISNPCHPENLYSIVVDSSATDTNTQGSRFRINFPYEYEGLVVSTFKIIASWPCLSPTAVYAWDYTYFDIIGHSACPGTVSASIWYGENCRDDDFNIGADHCLELVGRFCFAVGDTLVWPEYSDQSISTDVCDDCWMSSPAWDSYDEGLFSDSLLSPSFCTIFDHCHHNEPETVLCGNGFLDETTTASVLDKNIPSVFKLYHSYPNPFNPVTYLRYDLPEDGIINITIYDMMGRVVKTLVNSSQTAGYKDIQWNATNNRNEPVSAGLYLYTIQAGEFRKTKKMVLLK